ncbi:MAG: hypothetical protein P9M06_08090 [Candidatus Saelkia tenebricola]|nr:hypothetical protein [Candidatus Saelkia tenebricola]
MPGGDGTGPFGGGSGTGRGMGGGTGRGRMSGNRPGSGPAGNCVCPSCGNKMSHQVGVPCYSVNCSKCGAKMVRG